MGLTPEQREDAQTIGDVMDHLKRGDINGQAMREMTSEEIRADELSNLLHWIEGMHPGREELSRVLRDRVSTLDPEKAPQAEQPWSEHAARIEGAIKTAIAEMDNVATIEFLTRLITVATEIVRDRYPAPDESVPVQAEDDSFDGPSVLVLAAMLNGPSADYIDPRYRAAAATAVVKSLVLPDA